MSSDAEKGKAGVFGAIINFARRFVRRVTVLLRHFRFFHRAGIYQPAGAASQERPLERAAMQANSPANLQGSDLTGVQDCALFFGLLSEPTRLRILLALRDGPLHVTALCEILGLEQPNVSHHLGLLRRAGMVTDQRDGQHVFYETNPDRMSELLGALLRFRRPAGSVPATP